MAKKEDAQVSQTAPAPIQPASKAGTGVPDHAARMLHTADQTLKGFQKETPKTWDELSDAEKSEYRAKAQKVTSPGFSFEKAHDDEYALKKAQGWKFGGIHDADAKTDPTLIPYNQKPESERLKDSFIASFLGL